MRIAMLVLTLLVSMSMADVASGSLYYSAASDVDYLMESVGIYDGLVKIINVGGTTNYIIEFDEWFSWESDGDVNRLCAALVAVATVSTTTSWHSDFVVCMFDNDVLTMFTQDARTARNLVESGYDVTTFLGNNILVTDRSVCTISI